MKIQPTSKAAYESISLEEKKAMWANILKVLKRRKSGATAYEISQALKVHHVQVARRMAELVTSGQVINTKAQRPTNTGRMAIVRKAA